MPKGCLSPYPVAMIPYVNMLPYRMLGTPPHCCCHDYVPRDSVAALRAGKVMAAAVPVGALPVLGDWVEPLGHCGIAARESSMSVLFFSTRPFEQVCIDDRMTLTPDSATSVRLLYLLLSCRQPPGKASADKTADDPVGELIIGDRAMQRIHSWRRTKAGKVTPETMPDRYPYVTDLATCWYTAYGRPFVFARWVIRRDAPSEARAILTEWLENFERQEDELIARSIPIASRRLGLPEAWLEKYYRCLRRVLQAEDLEGQAFFLDEICRRQIDRAIPPEPSVKSETDPASIIDLGRPMPDAQRAAPHEPHIKAGAGRPVLALKEAS